MATAPASSPAWLPPAAGRALAWWSAQRLARLAAVLQESITPWQSDWALGAPVAVRCTELAPDWRASDEWAPVPGCEAWFSRGDHQGIARALFGARSADAPLARVAAAACADDARERLAVQLRAAQASSCDARPPGRGAVQAVLADPLGLCLVLPASLAAACLPPVKQAAALQSLAAVDEALAGRGCRLRAQLQGCTLDLGSLRQLQVGDVLRLPHRLEAQLLLTDGDDRPLFNAWLGHVHGCRAVALAAPAP